LKISEETPTGAKLDDDWKEMDAECRSSIGLAIEDSQINHVRKATTAKQAWKALRDYHQKSTVLPRIQLSEYYSNSSAKSH
jgi:hypothetical protein